jgi:hypothetical protein
MGVGLSPSAVGVTDGTMCRWRRPKVDCTAFRGLRALTQHFGIIIPLEVLDVMNRLQEVGASVVNGCTRFVNCRYLIRRALVINREWRTVEVLAFSHVVNCVDDHPNTFDERKSNDCVYRDMGAVAIIKDESSPPEVL